MKYKNDFNWRHQDGNAYIEYFVIAGLVAAATMVFFNAQLKNEGSGVRGHLEQNFVEVCKKVAGTADCPAPSASPSPSPAGS